MDTLKLTFLGQAGVALTYQGQTLVADPHLSDFLSHGNPNSPWVRSFPAPTTLEALNPSAILISHDHGDHLDPMTLKPYYEAGGKAELYVPAPVAGRAAFTDCTRPARAEETLKLGAFTVCPIPCAHTQLHQNEAGEYRELSYIIECGSIKVFFGGDCSFYEGWKERLVSEHFDLMILPVNGEDEERTSKGIIGNINEVQAAEVAAACDAMLLPMHHDLYAINSCPVERIRAAAVEHGVRLMLLSAGQSAVYEK